MFDIWICIFEWDYLIHSFIGLIIGGGRGRGRHMLNAQHSQASQKSSFDSGFSFYRFLYIVMLCLLFCRKGMAGQQTQATLVRRQGHSTIVYRVL